MFWNPRHWELRDSATPFFDELKRVGILHETPESAASHVATIWEDVDGWWAAPETQAVLSRFKARYCHLPDGLLDRVETVLRDARSVSCPRDRRPPQE
jgi:putative transferase (TIGR04331 family)